MEWKRKADLIMNKIIVMLLHLIYDPFLFYFLVNLLLL